MGLRGEVLGFWGRRVVLGHGELSSGFGGLFGACGGGYGPVLGLCGKGFGLGSGGLGGVRVSEPVNRCEITRMGTIMYRVDFH